MDIINKDIDVPALHQEFKQTGAVTIKDLLCSDVAEAAYESLKNRVPWELHYKIPKSKTRITVISAEAALKLTDKEKLKLVPKVLTQKHNDLSFIYGRYTIPTAHEIDSEHSLILTRVIKYFNSREYLQLLGDITGDHSGKEVSAWASRYGPNHHLSLHDDRNWVQGRIAAHVLGLTKNWKKEWGGQFTFCDVKGKPTAYRSPKFNQLTLFKVPRFHLVTKVKPYAKESRYSIFGWYKAQKEYFNLEH